MPRGRKKGSWKCDECGAINPPENKECHAFERHRQADPAEPDYEKEEDDYEESKSKGKEGE